MVWKLREAKKRDLDLVINIEGCMGYDYEAEFLHIISENEFTIEDCLEYNNLVTNDMMTEFFRVHHDLLELFAELYNY